jgi:hypothetical protein
MFSKSDRRVYRFCSPFSSLSRLEIYQQSCGKAGLRLSLPRLLHVTRNIRAQIKLEMSHLTKSYVELQLLTARRENSSFHLSEGRNANEREHSEAAGGILDDIWASRLALSRRSSGLGVSCLPFRMRPESFHGRRILPLACRDESKMHNGGAKRGVSIPCPLLPFSHQTRRQAQRRRKRPRIKHATAVDQHAQQSKIQCSGDAQGSRLPDQAGTEPFAEGLQCMGIARACCGRHIADGPCAMHGNSSLARWN